MKPLKRVNSTPAPSAAGFIALRLPPCPHRQRSTLLACLLSALMIIALASCTQSKIQPSSQERSDVQRPPAYISPPADDRRLSGEARELTPAEPDQFLEEEIARFQELDDLDPEADTTEELADPDYDFPVVMNQHVEFYLDYFQNDLRQTFAAWLARSGRYVPLLQEKLEAAGLPKDLAYLPMIESGYKLTAYSRARAVGPWQFMAPTARQYGLAINDYIDERRDPVRSTQAAVDFLSDLYAQFDCWHLTVAAYNAGGGRIRGAIRRFDSNNFWEISQNNHLAKETRHYVPKLIAAIIIAKNPEQYGFDNIAYEEPLRYETMEVPRWTALEAVALAGDMDLEELHDLNRQLRRRITPPELSTYELRLPVGKKQQVAEKLPRVKAVAKTDYQTHVVGSGDTLTRICNRYNINKTTLLKANSLRSEQLVVGQRLRIPVQKTAYRLLPEGVDQSIEAALAGAGPDGLVLHKIKQGESLWNIARRYGVNVNTLAAWNDIGDPRRIRAGQHLALYLDPEPAGGRTLAAGPSKRTPEGRNQPDITYYQVQGGDTLWSIARKFETTTAMIREWNQLNGDIIHPGKKLEIRLADLR